jgi:heme exporter protein A
VVIGPNGAGKTTLVRLLAGLMRPTAGEVRLLGQPLGRGTHQARRAVGFLSHQSLLYDDLTLLENLTLAARLYLLERPVQVARTALEAAGLADRAADLPRRLSRGLLQRAALARSMLHNPRVLLLDEPFTGLDAVASSRLRSDLRAGLSRGLGLVLVTHNLPDAWELASRVAVLIQGRWAADEPRSGTLEDFLPRYQRLAGA